MCRNVKQYPEARQVDGLLLLRIDAPLYFANVNPVKDALAKYERRAQEAAEKQGQTLHFIIIDLSPVYDVDASAIHFFKVHACKACHSADSSPGPSSSPWRMWWCQSVPKRERCCSEL